MKYPNNIDSRRRTFIKGGAAALVASTASWITVPASAGAVSAQGAAYSAAPSQQKFWLTGVTLEAGFIPEDDFIGGTLTKKAALLIDKGKIGKVSYTGPDKDGVPQYDVRGALALPGFADMHVHLDKGNYGGPWRAATPYKGRDGRIREEKRVLPGYVADTERRATRLLDLITSYGVTFLRVQCNVDQAIEMRNLEKVLDALNAYGGKIEYEMVAFPQHGTIVPRMPALLDKALKNGCAFIGGVDPETLDGDRDKALGIMYDLAVKNNAKIDLHLHTGGKAGTDTMRAMVKLTEQAKLQNKVTISHAYALGAIEDSELNELLAAFKATGIDLISSAPIGGTMPHPVKVSAAGVKYQLGQDCINDLWSSFGSGSIIERASRMAERHGLGDEYALNRSLKYISRGITPLDDKGNVVWPKSGDAADIALLDACCSAEVVARRNPVKAVFKAGKPSVWKV